MELRRPSMNRRSIDEPLFVSVDGNRMIEKIAAEKELELKYGPTEASTIRRSLDDPSVRSSTRDAFWKEFFLFGFPFIFRTLLL